MTNPPDAREDLERVEKAGESFLSRDPFWPAQLTVLVALLLGITIPDKLTLHPTYLIPAMEGVLLAGLIVTTPWGQFEVPHPRRRIGAIVLIALVTATNLLSLVLLSHELLIGRSGGNGHELILAGVEIWINNVLIFALWYWMIDRGGPRIRDYGDAPSPDFLFVPMTEQKLGGFDWRPNYVDYIYTSFTNATAFSPTDTMPVSARAKMLMLVQSAAALWTIGLVVARAVNILS
jgi:hypothetical protein